MSDGGPPQQAVRGPDSGRRWHKYLKRSEPDVWTAASHLQTLKMAAHLGPSVVLLRDGLISLLPRRVPAGRKPGRQKTRDYGARGEGMNGAGRPCVLAGKTGELQGEKSGVLIPKGV